MALSLDPEMIGLSTYLPFAQVVAVRGIVAAALAALAVAAMLISAAARQWNKRTPQLTLIAVVALAVALGHAGTLTTRWNGAPNSGPHAPSSDTHAPNSDPHPQAIKILTLNTYGNAAISNRLHPLIPEHTPHIIALQETAITTAERFQREAAQQGHHYQLFTAGEGAAIAAQSALLVHEDLGEYRQLPAPATTFATVLAEPIEPSGAPMMAVIHAVPPLPKTMATWRAEVRGAVELCEENASIVVAGDFNATPDHGPLRTTDCLVASANLPSTWPASQSTWLGTTIDHVIADAGAWHSTSARVVSVPGSDHRAVLAELVPQG